VKRATYQANLLNNKNANQQKERKDPPIVVHQISPLSNNKEIVKQQTATTPDLPYSNGVCNAKTVTKKDHPTNKSSKK